MDEAKTPKTPHEPHHPEQQTPDETAKANRWWHSKKAKWITAAVITAVVIIVGFLLLVVKGSNGGTPRFAPDSEGERSISESDAVKAGKQLTNNQCQGEGVPYKLSASPMRPDEFSIIIPYGLMIGGHVTPIDHQYFSPKDYNSKPDAYEVLAMADSTIVDIGSRPRPFGKEYRLVFSVTCTFLYYYDLVTSLSPDIQKAYDQAGGDTGNRKPLNIAVKAGQKIGRIGGQTLDFAVWDTTKPLNGFVVPEHYKAESWKIFTADPLNYYTDELKKFILTRYVRTAQPVSGKIDYDIDGRLIGNWFLEGTNGYEGNRQAEGGAYWATHLSFAPDHLDPSWFVISIGELADTQGTQTAQFVAQNNSPNPKDVSVDTGLVKYTLRAWSYFDKNGRDWDRNSVVNGVTIKPSLSQASGGCVLLQMTEARKIKFELFKNKSCGAANGFSSNAKTYTR